MEDNMTDYPLGPQTYDGVKKEVYPGINLFEDFLTDEECSWLIQYAESLSADEWKDLYTKNQSHAEERDGHGQDNFWSDKVAEIPFGNEMMNIINLRVKSVLPENEYHTTLNRIQRQYTGTALPKHYDGAHSESLIGAVILYLNDDYSDGELVFDKLDIQFRPPKRSMLTFLSSEDYSHLTNVVGDGPTRYVLATFTWNNEESSWTGR